MRDGVLQTILETITAVRDKTDNLLKVAFPTENITQQNTSQLNNSCKKARSRLLLQLLEAVCKAALKVS